MERVFLKWVEGLKFLLTDTENHQVLLDTSKESGGEGKGFKPIHLFMASIACCMAMDIVLILKKKREDLKDFSVEITGERANEHPKRFVKIDIKFKVNEEVNKKSLEEAFLLSKEKYCSVLHSVLNKPEINFYFE
ncbi:MAG: OsmC family protein [candidate division WOR-3 bacterium]|nr:OsmC family protein [candidate division WOR-3 bacterium]MCX7837561.1 OsmC family protein [candidate division WOR-3 bacterium]MDW8113998.1 OsmC family protein [candidate division WOR-3 bacterium]